MKVPTWIIPCLIVLAIAAGVETSKWIRIPSAELEIASEKVGTKSMRSVFIVDGVTCRDTAISAMSTLEDLIGVYHATAYASHNRIDVKFDPEKIDVTTIANAFSNPIFFEETGEILFNLYRVVEINGEPVELTGQ